MEKRDYLFTTDSSAGDCSTHSRKKKPSEITSLCPLSTRKSRIKTQDVNVCSEKYKKIKIYFIPRPGRSNSNVDPFLPQPYRRRSPRASGVSMLCWDYHEGCSLALCPLPSGENRVMLKGWGWLDEPGAERCWGQITQDLKLRSVLLDEHT